MFVSIFEKSLMIMKLWINWYLIDFIKLQKKYFDSWWSKVNKFRSMVDIKNRFKINSLASRLSVWSTFKYFC